MRNYVSELRQLGLSVKGISEQTGISQSQLKRYQTGAAKLTSTSEHYETIRNAARRTGYQQARAAGLSPGRATEIRRMITDPGASREQERVRAVKTQTVGARYQVRILGQFKHGKTKRIRIAEGFSMARIQLDNVAQTAEAIRFAQASLGGTGWQLQRIIEHEVTTYQLS